MTKLAISVEGRTHTVELEVHPGAETITVWVDGRPVIVRPPAPEVPLTELEWLIVDDRPYEIAFDADLSWVRSTSGLHRLEVRDLAGPAPRPSSGDGRLKAPIPGLINRLLVTIGQAVAAGEPILILEAMKMENEIRAPRTGVVAAIHVTAGQTVAREEVLVEIV